MTGLLQKALRRIEVLSEEEQNAIATQIPESLDDKETWAQKPREQPDLLRSRAREASRNIGVVILALLMNHRMKSDPLLRQRFHPPLNFVLIEDLALGSFAPAALDSLANINGVLRVVPTRIVGNFFDHRQGLFFNRRMPSA